MKKIFVFGVVVGAILALAGMAFSVYTATTASAAESQAQTAWFAPGPGASPMFFGRGGFGERGNGPLQPYIEEAVAGLLGMSVEELQAAKEAGTTMAQLLEDAGLTAEEFRAALEAALPGLVEQALADGAITQEQADIILENGLHKRGGPGGGGPAFPGNNFPLSSYIEAAMADVLGMSVEELQAAKEAGTRLSELLETAGLTVEEFRAAMEAAIPSIVEQALADGVITQAQADYILENGLHGGKGYLRGVLQGYIEAAMADILGITVEELQAAKEAGTPLAELVEAAGLTMEEFRSALQDAAPGIVEQALADGVITEQQADFILEKLQRGLGGFGPGGRGPHGSGFFGPVPPDFPVTDLFSESG